SSDLRDVEDASQSVLHLRDRVALQDNHGLTLLLGLLHPLRLTTIVVFDRNYRVSIALVIADDDWHAQLTRRLRQPVAAHAERVDVQRLENGQVLRRAFRP